MCLGPPVPDSPVKWDPEARRELSWLLRDREGHQPLGEASEDLHHTHRWSGSQGPVRRLRRRRGEVSWVCELKFGSLHERWNWGFLHDGTASGEALRVAKPESAVVRGVPSRAEWNRQFRIGWVGIQVFYT